MTDDSARFAGKTSLITGGSSGMGLATARRLLAEGAHVVITGIGQTELDAAVKELSSGDQVTALLSDVSKPSDLDALSTVIRERYGQLDMVFANAGVASFAPLAEVTEAEVDRVIGINFKGVFFTIQKMLPLMPKGAAIVINASWTVHRGLSAASLYSASKAAIHSLTRTLAAELGPKGIRVNSISPGYITTPMFHAAIAPEDHARILAQVASGRLGTADDIANVVAFLGWDETSYVNGQDLIIDGGLVAAVPQQN